MSGKECVLAEQNTHDQGHPQARKAQLLEDEGLVHGRDSEGRKVYELTERGRTQADAGQLRDLAAGTAAGSAHLDLRVETHRLHAAARQVGAAGDPAQVQEAVEIIRGARQALYRLLAQ